MVRASNDDLAAAATGFFLVGDTFRRLEFAVAAAADAVFVDADVAVVVAVVDVVVVVVAVVVLRM